jgi:hypothetical protein
MKVSNSLLEHKEIAAADEDHLRALACLYQVIDPVIGINLLSRSETPSLRTWRCCRYLWRYGLAATLRAGQMAASGVGY